MEVASGPMILQIVESLNMVFPNPQNQDRRVAGRSIRGFGDLNLNDVDLRGWKLVDVTEIDRREPEWTAEAGRKMLAIKNQQFTRRVSEHLDHWSMDAPLREALLGLIGNGPRPINDLASNQALKKHVAEAGSDMIQLLADEDPKLKFYFGTIFDDKVRTSDRRTCLDLEPFKKRVRNILAEGGITEWVGLIELEGETNSVRGYGRAIIPHAHVIFWRSGAFKPKLVSSKLSQSRRLESAIGAPTVKIKKRKDADSAAYTMSYVNKPAKGANLIPSRKNPGKFVRREARLRTNHLIRIIEALSHYQFENLLMSGGKKGMAFRRHLMAAVAHYRNSPSLRARSRTQTYR